MLLTPPAPRRSAALDALLASDGLYRLRAPAHLLSPEASEASGLRVAAFLPLRCLVAASLAEHVVLSVDGRRPRIAGRDVHLTEPAELPPQPGAESRP